jgi:hypothetical protein
MEILVHLVMDTVQEDGVVAAAPAAVVIMDLVEMVDLVEMGSHFQYLQHH